MYYSWDFYQLTMTYRRNCLEKMGVASGVRALHRSPMPSPLFVLIEPRNRLALNLSNRLLVNEKLQRKMTKNISVENFTVTVAPCWPIFYHPVCINVSYVLYAKYVNMYMYLFIERKNISANNERVTKSRNKHAHTKSIRKIISEIN